MLITNLPVDVLRSISSELNCVDKFNLALTCKSMYEKSKHVKHDEVFDLRLTEQVGSFFHATVLNVEVELHLRSIDYNALHEQLSKIYYLKSLRISFSDCITPKIAHTVISCIPKMGNHPVELIIKGEHNFVVMNKAAKLYNNQYVTVKRVNERVVKRRTPSPLREAIDSVKRLRTLFEQQEGNDENLVPIALNEIIQRDAFQESNLDSDILKVANNTHDAEDNIKNFIAPKLLESVVMFKKNWIFITQFEVYYRNDPQIDASAIETKKDKYHKKPTAKIKTKSEKGKVWYEMSIFWGRYELLVTGGLCGSAASEDLAPFLGSNVPLKELIEDESTVSDRLYINNSSNGIDSFYQVRNLRNWNKPSSSLKWLCISNRFKAKDFATINPLHIRTAAPATVLMSIILYHISSQEFYTESQYQDVLQLFKQTKWLKSLPELAKIKTFRKIAEKLATDDKAEGFKTLAEYMEKVKKKKGNPLNILSTDQVVSLSSKVYGHAKTRNERALKCYRL